MQNFRRYIEASGAPYRLGRHRVWDALPRELEAVIDLLEPIKSVQHVETQPVWDQGSIGSCTANAALGCLVTGPFARAGVTFSEADAVELYTLESGLDDSQIPGQYPPNDTGSTGPWSMLALQQQGRIKSFRHARSLHATLRLLNTGPVSIGVTWWNSFFTPDSTNTLVLDRSSGIGGGHQVAVTANDADNRRVLIRNSWGESWGDAGHAWLPWSVLDDLFADGGDAVQPIL